MAVRFRVLMISPQFRPLLGGYEQAAERLALALSRRGDAVTVLAERRDPDWAREEFLEGVRIRRLPYWGRRWLHSLGTIFFLGAYLLVRARAFDVIHVHQYGWPSTLAVVFGRILGRPVVLKLTSTGPQGIGVVLGRLPFPSLQRAVHRHLSGCIATSQRGRDEMVEIGLPSSRVHLIPNGLDTQIFRPTTGPDREQARARLGLDASPLVVTVCRLSPEKKLPGLLEAWARIRPAHPEARLAIVGDGSEMPGLRKQAERLGLGGSLLLPGNCSDPESWYFAGDMYVLCSSHEGLSNSLIEALCCGLPIVSTRVSGSEDILAAVDVGLLVPVDDEDALGDAISELLADPERARACGRRAGEYGTAHYSLASVTEQVERLYAGVTGINPAP